MRRRVVVAPAPARSSIDWLGSRKPRSVLRGFGLAAPLRQAVSRVPRTGPSVRCDIDRYRYPRNHKYRCALNSSLPSDVGELRDFFWRFAVRQKDLPTLVMVALGTCHLHPPLRL